MAVFPQSMVLWCSPLNDLASRMNNRILRAPNLAGIAESAVRLVESPRANFFGLFVCDWTLPCLCNRHGSYTDGD